MTYLRSIALAAFSLTVLSPVQAGDLANGTKIAESHCQRCHVVSEANKFTGIMSTPSFMMMVNNMEDWEERFQTFFARRPHGVHVRIEGIPPPTALPPNAAEFEMTLKDVEDIVEYARSLKTQ